MKKCILILLMGFYAVSIAGISIKTFYCCGKLKSTTLSFIERSKEKCSKASGMSGCCKTTFHAFKVNDSHIGADVSEWSHALFPEATVFNTVVTRLGEWPQQSVSLNPSHAPPFYNTVPLHISYCVYRI